MVFLFPVIFCSLRREFCTAGCDQWCLPVGGMYFFPSLALDWPHHLPGPTEVSASDACHVDIKALKARVGFCSVSLSLAMRMETGLVPSAWVPEQEGIWSKATADPHLMSNVGERESFLVEGLFVPAASPSES